MDAAEVEFLAEKELVTIIPNFMPLWLAINLNQRQKCRLLPPEWMDVEKMEQIQDQERKEETFTPVPSPHYMEITKLLLNHASDNISKADTIRTLIKDLRDTRMAKLRVSADNFVWQQEAHINTSRAFLTQALKHMYKLRTNLQPAESTQSQEFYPEACDVQTLAVCWCPSSRPNRHSALEAQRWKDRCATLVEAVSLLLISVRTQPHCKFNFQRM
uniref:GINS complex subunit 2 n=1 Tax=Cricetulus griseus TaxID=10029 RepID=A0A8C2MRP9_CRIGR